MMFYAHSGLKPCGSDILPNRWKIQRDRMEFSMIAFLLRY